jgi:hypothetical protein
MKIILVNASPKPGRGTSAFLVQTLERLLAGSHEVVLAKVGLRPPTEGELAGLLEAEVLVLAFPLYADAIPSHLMGALVRLATLRSPGPHRLRMVYALVNNGFFEGEQNHLAFEILGHWCRAQGWGWGGGIGHGAGEMVGQLGSVPLGHGPLKNLGRALIPLAEAISKATPGETRFLRPNFPRFLWRLAAVHGFWYPQARNNGLHPRDLSAQP